MSNLFSVTAFPALRITGELELIPAITKAMSTHKIGFKFREVYKRQCNTLELPRLTLRVQPVSSKLVALLFCLFNPVFINMACTACFIH